MRRRRKIVSKQISLFEEEKSNVIKDEDTGRVERVVKKEYSIEYCFDTIRNDHSLWDMRCWDTYKDSDEVLAWVNSLFDGTGGDKNCRHVCYCIRLLFDYKVDIVDICQAIMDNPHISFKDRLVRCWDDSKKCKFYSVKNGFSKCPCKKCNGDK